MSVKRLILFYENIYFISYEIAMVVYRGRKYINGIYLKEKHIFH